MPWVRPARSLVAMSDDVLHDNAGAQPTGPVTNPAPDLPGEAADTATRALGRYRVMAWVTGVMLLVLVGVAMPLKYAAGNDAAVAVVGPIHGLLYIVYLLTVIDLASRRRWPLSRIAAAVLAGVVPFMAFIVEHRIVIAERRAMTVH